MWIQKQSDENDIFFGEFTLVRFTWGSAFQSQSLSFITFSMILTFIGCCAHSSTRSHNQNSAINLSKGQSLKKTKKNIQNHLLFIVVNLTNRWNYFVALISNSWFSGRPHRKTAKVFTKFQFNFSHVFSLWELSSTDFSSYFILMSNVW